MNRLIRPPGTKKDRGFTQDLFGMTEIEGAYDDPYWGSALFDDFLGGHDNRYVETDLNSSSGTVTHLPLRHGAIRLSPVGTTDNHGEQLQFGNGFFLPVAGTVCAFETLIRLSTISTEPQVLIGMAEDDTSLLGATGAISVDDFIGFYMSGADLELDFHVRVGGVSNIEHLGCGPDVVDGDWMHLGFRVEDGKRFVPFVNQVEITDDITVNAAAVPTVPLAPSWAIVGAGTVTPTLDVDWWLACDGFKGDVRS